MNINRWFVYSLVYALTVEHVQCSIFGTEFRAKVTNRTSLIDPSFLIILDLILEA